jgi:Na+-translocating ferredoxin:NAD+ oxidoreductase subunit G
MTDEMETRPAPEPTLQQSMLRAGIGLGLFAILTAGAIALTQTATDERIATQIKASQLRSLAQIVPADLHDNDLIADSFTLAANPTLGLSADAEAFIARKDSYVTALILPVVATEGYTGPIRLVMGITPEGKIQGVRVIEHKETPGLGDKIEVRKGNWILGFDGKSLQEPDATGWKVKKDGGQFDQMTGATITPRAIVKSIHTALTFFDRHREQLLSAQPGTRVVLENSDGAK